MCRPSSTKSGSLADALRAARFARARFARERPHFWCSAMRAAIASRSFRRFRAARLLNSARPLPSMKSPTAVGTSSSSPQALQKPLALGWLRSARSRGPRRAFLQPTSPHRDHMSPARTALRKTKRWSLWVCLSVSERASRVSALRASSAMRFAHQGASRRTGYWIYYIPVTVVFAGWARLLDEQ
jgi:hypothetical protein